MTSTEERLTRVETLIERMEPDIKEIRGDVKVLLGYKDKSSGGWKAIATTSTISAMLVGAIVGVLRWLHG